MLRAMDNGFYAPRPLIDRFLSLAGRRDIPPQVGFTGGATDGMPCAIHCAHSGSG